MELFVRSDSVISRVIAGETLIVPIRKGVGDLASIYSLNSVGSAIWEAVSIPRSKREIMGRVKQEFTGDPPRIERDVDSFLAELEHEGLVTSVGARATL